MFVLLLFSSPHSFSTGFRSEDWDDHIRSLFFAQWPIFVLFLRFVFGLLYSWKIKTWPIIRFLIESVTYCFFNLLVFARIHDAMCLNKMSRTSSRNIGPQNKKYSSIFHCTHGELFIPVFTKPILSVCIFLFHLTIEASPIWSSSRVWQLNMLEFERKQRTHFCICLNFHSNQSVNTRRIHILALRRMQKSIRCLRSMGNIQNGATVTRRDREETNCWKKALCVQKVFSSLH